jgi:DNA-binding MarR family transcriptional regulator
VTPADDGRQPSAAAGGPISHVIFRLARAHHMLAGQLLREVGLFPGQELLMMHLWDNGPQRQSALATEFDTDSASMTRTVQRLERAGYVRRVADPDDGRATLVEPTAAGLSLRDRIEQMWRRLEELTVADLSAEQQRRALSSLRRLEDNLLAVPAKSRLGQDSAAESHDGEDA